MPQPTEAAPPIGPTEGGWPARRPAVAPVVSLDAQIRAVEERLIARDERLHRRVGDLGSRVRAALRPGRLAAIAAAGVGVAVLGVWAVRRGVVRLRRPERLPKPAALAGLAGLAVSIAAAALGRDRLRSPAPHVAGGRQPTPPWVPWLGMLWPMLLPRGLRRRIPPGAAMALAGAGVPMLQGLLHRGARPPLATVASLDLQRYAGTWHEIARLPEPFESVCVGQPEARYTPTPDGEVRVENRCAGPGGRPVVARGVARVVPDSGNARLKVTFAPQWARALPFVWADYWVLHVDEDYRTALVGEPRRRFLWILSREPHPGEADIGPLVDLAAARGFPVERLRFNV